MLSTPTLVIPVLYIVTTESDMLFFFSLEIGSCETTCLPGFDTQKAFMDYKKMNYNLIYLLAP